MGLSIDKLIKLFKRKGFVPKRFYKLYGICILIEVISVKNAENYMIYIPSKYEFNVDNLKNSFDLKIIGENDENDENEKQEDIEEYVGEPDPFDLEKKYEEIFIDKDITKDDDIKMSERLKNNYKKNINLKEFGEGDKADVSCIFRQLKRLKYCVQNLRYRLVIIYKSYLCVLHIDDSVECFLIKKFNHISDRQLLITMDLELFYENIENIENELNQIRNGIQKILDRNYETHAKNLFKILEKRANTFSLSQDIQNKRREYEGYIGSFGNLLTDSLKNENNMIKKLYLLESKKKKEFSIRGLQGDIEFSHEKERIVKKLEEAKHIKNQVIDSIIKVRAKLDNISLQSDKIIFDNIVMVDKIFNNLDMLTNLTSS